MTKRTFTTAEVREIAVAASVDPRTVERILRGEPVRGMAALRIARVLVERGFIVPGFHPHDALELVDRPKPIAGVGVPWLGPSMGGRGSWGPR